MHVASDAEEQGMAPAPQGPASRKTRVGAGIAAAKRLGSTSGRLTRLRQAQADHHERPDEEQHAQGGRSDVQPAHALAGRAGPGREVSGLNPAEAGRSYRLP